MYPNSNSSGVSISFVQMFALMKESMKNNSSNHFILVRKVIRFGRNDRNGYSDGIEM